MAYSIAVAFTTGRLPGSPRSTGVVSVFGAASWFSLFAGFGASLNIFVLVESSTWISRPITGSNISSALS